ncbi:hypothetical protein FJ934_22490 [Mesorhizobium sp. B2-4-12]|nr:hypothetical protein FJ934_22490 [Mesorhizobium sp. B2-4-12]
MNRPTSSTAPIRPKPRPRSCRPASTAGIIQRSKSSGTEQGRSNWAALPLPIASTTNDGAAPHPPAGTFSPYSDGEKGRAAALATPSPVLYGERVRVRGSAAVERIA